MKMRMRKRTGSDTDHESARAHISSNRKRAQGNTGLMRVRGGRGAQESGRKERQTNERTFCTEHPG